MRHVGPFAIRGSEDVMDLDGLEAGAGADRPAGLFGFRLGEQQTG